MTRVLHTAKISNVESTVCDNEERKMVNFKLGKKWERWHIQFKLSKRKILTLNKHFADAIVGLNWALISHVFNSFPGEHFSGLGLAGWNTSFLHHSVVFLKVGGNLVHTNLPLSNKSNITLVTPVVVQGSHLSRPLCHHVSYLRI